MKTMVELTLNVTLGLTGDLTLTITTSSFGINYSTILHKLFRILHKLFRHL